MNTKLKKAIIDYVYDHLHYWQLTNTTVDHFREYIYKQDGNYLIGGAGVYKFIQDTIRLLTVDYDDDDEYAVHTEY